MMELEELRLATNWQNIHEGKDCLVISFKDTDARKIQGLSRNGNNYFLKFPEYQQHPISFIVSIGDARYQYWVLGERLHRVDGPALVTYNPTTGKSEQGWFYNGLPHNSNGPASIKFSGLRFDGNIDHNGEFVSDDFVVENWGKMECHWFYFGKESGFPYPQSAEFTNGHRIFRAINNTTYLHGVKQGPAFYANEARFNWGSGKSEEFRPRMLMLYDYQRFYTSGDFNHHTVDRIGVAQWIHNDELITTDDREAITRLQKNMFPNWNLWDGPFFKDEQEEMFTMAEAIK